MNFKFSSSSSKKKQMRLILIIHQLYPNSPNIVISICNQYLNEWGILFIFRLFCTVYIILLAHFNIDQPHSQRAGVPCGSGHHAGQKRHCTFYLGGQIPKGRGEFQPGGKSTDFQWPVMYNAFLFLLATLALNHVKAGISYFQSFLKGCKA